MLDLSGLFNSLCQPSRKIFVTFYWKILSFLPLFMFLFTSSSSSFSCFLSCFLCACDIVRMHHATYFCLLQNSETFLFELFPYTLLGILNLLMINMQPDTSSNLPLSTTKFRNIPFGTSAHIHFWGFWVYFLWKWKMQCKQFAWSFIGKISFTYNNWKNRIFSYEAFKMTISYLIETTWQPDPMQIKFESEFPHSSFLLHPFLRKSELLITQIFYLGNWGYNTQKEREEAASIPRIQVLDLSAFSNKLK